MNLPVIALCSLYEHLADLSAQDRNRNPHRLRGTLPVSRLSGGAYATAGHFALHFAEDFVQKLQLMGWPQLWQHMILVSVVLALWHQEHRKSSSLRQSDHLFHTQSNCLKPCPEAWSSRARENGPLQESR